MKSCSPGPIFLYNVPNNIPHLFTPGKYRYGGAMGVLGLQRWNRKQKTSEFFAENLHPGVVFNAENEYRIHFLWNAPHSAPASIKVIMVEKKSFQFFHENMFSGTVFDADFENNIHFSRHLSKSPIWACRRSKIFFIITHNFNSHYFEFQIAARQKKFYPQFLFHILIA